MSDAELLTEKTETWEIVTVDGTHWECERSRPPLLGAGYAIQATNCSDRQSVWLNCNQIIYAWKHSNPALPLETRRTVER